MTNNIAKYADLQREWFNYGRFYKFIASHQDFHTFVEIGVWKGHAISFLASQLINRPDIEIYGVDLFGDRMNNGDYAPYIESSDYQLSKTYEMYNYNLKATNTRHLITDVRCCSWEAADQFEDQYFDFIFVDADHHYESVVKDITAWIPKIKKTGILAGHDYNAPAVNRAVKDVCGNRAIAYPPCKCVWYIPIMQKVI